MFGISRKTYILALAIAVAGLLPSASFADSIGFTYQGTTSLDGGDVSTGSGSLTFTPVAGPIGLAQLTAFTFSLSTDSGFLQYSYGLPDVTAFSLSAASPGATITLQTAFKPNLTANTGLPENFRWTGPLGSSTGLVMAQQPPPAGAFDVDTGAITASYSASAVPEPTSAALLLGGLVFAAAMWLRRATA